MRRRGLVSLLVILLLADAARAATLVVRQDGTGQFSSISAAISAAAAGDVIKVGPGTYTNALTISKSLDLDSESGAAVTILDGANAHRAVLVQGGCTVTLRGFTLTRARADEGAALLAWQQVDVLMEDCIVADNFATGSNAVQVRHAGSTLRILSTRFLRNQSVVSSGALSASMGASLHVKDAQFIENRAAGHGAMNVLDAHVEMKHCLFLRNVGGAVGALTTDYSTGFVTDCTFEANSGSDCSVLLADYTFFSRNIVSGELRGYGLATPNGTVHTCNLYYDNLRGACNRALGAGEIQGDPLFCDAGGDVYTVCSSSPALGTGVGCGPMGAFGKDCECGPVATRKSSWGDLKSRFR